MLKPDGDSLVRAAAMATANTSCVEDDNEPVVPTENLFWAPYGFALLTLLSGFWLLGLLGAIATAYGIHRGMGKWDRRNLGGIAACMVSVVLAMLMG